MKVYQLLQHTDVDGDPQPFLIYQGSAEPVFDEERSGWDCESVFITDAERTFYKLQVDSPAEAPEVSRMRFKLLWGAVERIEIYARAETEPAFKDFIRLLDDPMATTVEMANQSVAMGIGFIVNALAAIPNDQKAHRYGQILSNIDPS